MLCDFIRHLAYLKSLLSTYFFARKPLSNVTGSSRQEYSKEKTKTKQNISPFDSSNMAMAEDAASVLEQFVQDGKSSKIIMFPV